MAGQIRKSAKSDRSWLALAVLVLGLAATWGTWYVFRSHEREQIRWATKLAADAIRIDLTTDMEWQMFGLDRLALLWEAADTPQPQPLWTKNADLYIQHRPGCVAVEWLTPDGNKRVVRGRQSNVGGLAFDGVPREWIQAAAASKVARISAPSAGARRRQTVRHSIPGICERGTSRLCGLLFRS
jgi:sensor domain CHASE-containing protein